MPADVPCWEPVSYRTLRGGNLLLVPGTPRSQVVCGYGLETPRLPLSRLQDGDCPRERQEHVCIPLFSDSDSWNLHPLGFAIFTHPEPSGLHGDASKQQIPGGNDVTFPFPAAQASRHCCLGPRGCPVLCPLGAALSQDSRSAGHS